MTQEYLLISTDGGKNWREMRDTATTDTYITKLSHSATLLCMFDTGEWHEMECGKIVRSGLSNCPGYENTKWGMIERS